MFPIHESRFRLVHKLVLFPLVLYSSPGIIHSLYCTTHSLVYYSFPALLLAYDSFTLPPTLLTYDPAALSSARDLGTLLQPDIVPVKRSPRALHNNGVPCFGRDRRHVLSADRRPLLRGSGDLS